MGRRLGMLSPVSGDGRASTHSIEGGAEGVVTAELPCGRAARAVRLQCRCVRGVGRVRRGVQLPLLELPRGHWLRVPALGRDRAREADGDQGHGHAAPRRRSRRPPRDTLRDVPLAALLDGLRRQGPRAVGVAERRARSQADRAHVRRLEGAVVRDPRRPSPARRVPLGDLTGSPGAERLRARRAASHSSSGPWGGRR